MDSHIYLQLDYPGAEHVYDSKGGRYFLPEIATNKQVEQIVPLCSKEDPRTVLLALRVLYNLSYPGLAFRYHCTRFRPWLAHFNLFTSLH